MLELIDALSAINFTVFKIAGMMISGIVGLIMSRISMRSVNYRKIDKSAVLSSILFFVYINSAIFAVSFFGTLAVIILYIQDFALLMLIGLGLAAITALIFWGLMLRKSKRMKTMMEKAKLAGKGLFLMLHWVSAFSILLNFIYMPYLILEMQSTTAARAIFVISWICTAWWLALIVSFIWRTAKYIFSEMKITLVDGEIVQYSCSPQMCRVHKNYIRLIERNEKGIITRERHINEASIKQIEYY